MNGSETAEKHADNFLEQAFVLFLPANRCHGNTCTSKYSAGTEIRHADQSQPGWSPKIRRHGCNLDNEIKNVFSQKPKCFGSSKFHFLNK